MGKLCDRKKPVFFAASLLECIISNWTYTTDFTALFQSLAFPCPHSHCPRSDLFCVLVGLFPVDFPTLGPSYVSIQSCLWLPLFPLINRKSKFLYMEYKLPLIPWPCPFRTSDPIKLALLSVLASIWHHHKAREKLEARRMCRLKEVIQST